MDFQTKQMTNYSVTASTPNMSIVAGTTNVNFSNLNNFAIAETGTWTCSGGMAACAGNASLAFVGPQAGAVLTAYTIADPNGSVSMSGEGLVKR